MTGIEVLARNLSTRFGLALLIEHQEIEDGWKVRIRPDGLPPTIAFHVDLLMGWRRIKADFIPDNYASNLLRAMSQAVGSQGKTFAVFARSLREKGGQVTLSLDDRPSDPVAPDTWPVGWQRISLHMQKIGVVSEVKGQYNIDGLFPWVAGFIGMVLALMPLEFVEEAEVSRLAVLTGEIEGESSQRTITVYERSRINRAACIEIHGLNCKICNFNFKEIYGDIGEGFIHVHHIHPLAHMKGSQVIDPVVDLLPVCPNCHCMLHRSDPPMDPDELREKLRCA
ncbi:MAG: hypothetical protein VX792_16015 [Candidatus Latescibacterota bacterium]|nr:hypothetical protein [Candidatus Latescibacterota bacterium]